jgi:uncharacterized protein YegL
MSIDYLTLTIEKQKKLKGERHGEVYVSTILFNTSSEVIHDRVPIDEVTSLEENDYRVGGGTALLDAIGDAVEHVTSIHKYIRREDVPENTIVMITTDGEENSSHKYTKKDIKDRIKRQSEECGWEFIFLAANIDAVSTAAGIGIRQERAASYRQDKDGVEATYDAMCEAISAMRCQGSIDNSEWRKKLDC